MTSTTGHLLVYGYYSNLDCISSEEIINKVHQQNGIVIVSHPFRYEDYSDLTLDQLQIEFARFDGIEALNGNQSSKQNNYALKIWESLGICGIGGSDAHSVNMVGRHVTEFQNEIRNEKDLIKEIKAGRCSPVSISDKMFTNTKVL